MAGNIIFGASLPTPWYNSSWAYRRPITITGSTSDLTNYQTKIVVTYDSDMKTDFSDIRFTSSNGTTEINYWTETYTASTSATFWVKVPSIPTAGTTIYMYYGNASASSVSNGMNTFMFFDDFSVDLSKWNKYQSGTAIISGGVVQIRDIVSIIGKTIYALPLVMEGRVKHIYDYVQLINLINDVNYSGNLWSSTNSVVVMYFSDPNPDKIYLRTDKNGVTSDVTICNGVTGVFENWKIVMDGTNAKVYKNDSFVYTKSDNIPIVNLAPALGGYEATASMDVDWIFVRQYASPEPGSSVGNEEGQ